MHMMTINHIIPALTKIGLNISGCWSLDEGVHVMPRVRGHSLLVAAQRCCEGMFWRIPTIIVSRFFDERINSSDESIGAINNRNFLMERFNGMVENTLCAIVKDAGDTSLCKLLIDCFWLVVREEIAAFPEQHFNLNAFSYSVGKDVFYRQGWCSHPEGDIRIRKAFSS